MNAWLRIVPAILFCSIAAAPVIAQGGAKLAVGPDAGGYLCPDGRQLYIKSCYDNSPNANCGVVLMHLPAQRGYQQERSQTRSEIAPSVAACKVYPLEFRDDGTIQLLLPKSTPPQQTAKAPAAQAPQSSIAPGPPATGETLDLTVGDGMAFGYKDVRSSLVRISPANAASPVFYVDEASRRLAPNKVVTTIWSLRVYIDGNAPDKGAAARWVEYLVNCKQSSFEESLYLSLDRQAKMVLVSVGDVSGKVTKGSLNEVVAGIACKPTPSFKGPRFPSAAAAIADAFAGAAPKTVVKAVTPAAKPVVVAKPTKARIRLPETDTEKAFFQAVKTSQFQAAINRFASAPGGKLAALAELTDSQGMTALHWAAANRGAALTRWLLDKGSEVDLADEKGRTPLKIALDNKDTKVMSVLLNIGGANAQFAWPGHDDELKSIKKTDDLIDFMIKAAAPAGN